MGVNFRIQRGEQHPLAIHGWRSVFLGEGITGGIGASQLKWEWHCAHASVCGCFLHPGNEKYEKALREVKEKLEDNRQRGEAVVLGEAAAAEPPTDDSGTVVRTAAAPFGTCHPPPASFGPLAPCSRLPGALLALGSSLSTPGHGHASAERCPPLAVVPLGDA